MFSITNKLSPTVTDMIRFDHSHVLVTFHQYTVDKSPKVRKALAETICTALEIHAQLEEEIFYPAVRSLHSDESVISKSVPEHDEMRRLIAALRSTPPSDDRHAEILHELMQDVIHHVADEECVLLPEAESMLSKIQLSNLGIDMTKRRAQLLAPQLGKVAVNTAVGFSSSTMAMFLASAALAIFIAGIAKSQLKH